METIRDTTKNYAKGQGGEKARRGDGKRGMNDFLSCREQILLLCAIQMARFWAWI